MPLLPLPNLLKLLPLHPPVQLSNTLENMSNRCFPRVAQNALKIALSRHKLSFPVVHPVTLKIVPEPLELWTPPVLIRATDPLLTYLPYTLNYPVPETKLPPLPKQSPPMVRTVRMRGPQAPQIGPGLLIPSLCTLKQLPPCPQVPLATHRLRLAAILTP